MILKLYHSDIIHQYNKKIQTFVLSFFVWACITVLYCRQKTYHFTTYLLLFELTTYKPSRLISLSIFVNKPYGQQLLHTNKLIMQKLYLFQEFSIAGPLSEIFLNESASQYYLYWTRGMYWDTNRETRLHYENMTFKSNLQLGAKETQLVCQLHYLSTAPKH